MSAVLKLLIKIILKKLQPYFEINEEQQGFRVNRSTTDAIFIVRQIVEKATEYNKPAYLCFVDLKKAFDRVKLRDIIIILRNKLVPVPNKLIETTEATYKDAKTK